MNNGFEELRGGEELWGAFCRAHAIEIKNEFCFCVMFLKAEKPGREGGGGETNEKATKEV